MLKLEDCCIERLGNAPVTDFDCGDKDLNEFLVEDALLHQDHLLAVTYLLRHNDCIVAYFSVLNDRIAVEQFPSSSQFRKLQRLLPYRKRRYKSYPAVKLGRFAVGTAFAKQGIGAQLLDYVKILFVSANKTGCRFITADAYKAAIPFYERNGFISLEKATEGSLTELMYFDLKPLAEGLSQLPQE